MNDKKAKETCSVFTNEKIKILNTGSESRQPFVSCYLLAQNEQNIQRQKDLLYETLGPVFFGRSCLKTQQDLEEYYKKYYGIDVNEDFCDGDEHYEEYQEARQAMAEGLQIYGGEIKFTDDAMAEAADMLWKRLEQGSNGGFRRINTMLEE